MKVTIYGDSRKLYDEAEERVSKVSCNNITFKVCACEYNGEYNGMLALEVYMKINNGSIGQTKIFAEKDVAVIEEMCYDAAANLYLHELNDSFKINDKKPLNPHFTYGGNLKPEWRVWLLPNKMEKI